MNLTQPQSLYMALELALGPNKVSATGLQRVTIQHTPKAGQIRQKADFGRAPGIKSSSLSAMGWLTLKTLHGPK